MDLAISPIDEAFRSVVGQGTGDASTPPPVNRTLYLAHEIDEDLSLAFISSIHRLHIEDTEDPINLIINSGGGDDVCGFGIYDSIEHAAEDVKVIATVQGGAMSMAAVILQAATERRMGANSYLMVHQSWGTLFGHSTTQVERQAKWWRDMEDRATRLLTARTKITAKALAKQIAAGDWYMDAREAKRLGFIDRIV